MSAQFQIATLPGGGHRVELVDGEGALLMVSVGVVERDEADRIAGVVAAAVGFSEVQKPDKTQSAGGTEVR